MRTEGQNECGGTGCLEKGWHKYHQCVSIEQGVAEQKHIPKSQHPLSMRYATKEEQNRRGNEGDGMITLSTHVRSVVTPQRVDQTEGSG